jgi:spermidine synthase
VLADALTIFLGAFLLLAIEPIIGKAVLPWFGGAPAVWTTCLLFFQGTLLAGYLYAHGLVRKLRPSTQRNVHLALLALSVFLLALGAARGTAVLPGAGWKPDGETDPILRILAILAGSVGLPFFLLSATGPLLQAWTARRRPDAPVYRLYAVSNAGSLLAPLTYPFLVEPVLTLKAQAAVWTCLYVGFAACCGFCAWRAARSPAPVAGPAPSETAVRPPYLFWFALSACGSLMLLATTNQMCQDVAAIPFLWLLPLSLYLVSFILCFESDRLYSRAVFGPLLAASLGWAALVLFRGYSVPARIQIAAYSLALFAACMVCHGELARSRPPPSRLTSFYLTIAAGGAAGGLFVALLAPALFRGYWELHVGLWLSGLLALAALWRDPDSWLRRGRPLPAIALLLAFAALAWQARGPDRFSTARERLRDALSTAPGILVIAGGAATVALLAWRLARKGSERQHPYLAVPSALGALVLLGFVLLSEVRAQRKLVVGMSRNFYGVLALEESYSLDPNSRRFELRHGRIVHGFQYQMPERRGMLTTYYGESSGIGLLLRNHPRLREGPVRVGVVGLGVGTLAAYGRPGDRYRFYEINPAVVSLSADSDGVFSYLSGSPARVEVALGDGRLSLERELRRGGPQNFDVLVLDAFSSDSIPVHLLTREAIAVALAHLRRPDGVLAIHISNRHLDLDPVVHALANAFGLAAVLVDTDSEGDAVWGATWVLLSRDRRVLEGPAIRAIARPLAGKKGVRMWTDDYSNLFRVLK